jgi:hypothetical protein
MTKNSALQAMAVKEALAREIEFAILGVLIHYNGRYEECLVEWYSALRLGLPQLTDTRQLRDVFKGLSALGIIALDRRNAGSHASHGPHDDRFFGRGPFMTTLTPAGLVHWNTVGVQPRQATAF